jgi:hypothetical protein
MYDYTYLQKKFDILAVKLIVPVNEEIFTATKNKQNEQPFTKP